MHWNPNIKDWNMGYGGDKTSLDLLQTLIIPFNMNQKASVW